MQTTSAHQSSTPAPHQENPTPGTALKTLMVAYDFSKSATTALRYAGELARTCSSEIMVAHVDSTETANAGTDRDRAKSQLQRLEEQHDLNVIANQLRSEGIKVSYLERSGSPPELLVQIVRECEPDLLLMGAYGFHGDCRTTLGSTAESILHSLSCPVLVVGPCVAIRPVGGVRLSEILYASQPPDVLGSAQDLACELARKFAMHIHVVHVEPDTSPSKDGNRRRNLEMREEKISDYFRRHGVGSSWTLRFGSQQDHFMEQAKVVSADLLIVAVPPATDASQIVVLNAIVRTVKCPILIVPGTC